MQYVLAGVGAVIGFFVGGPLGAVLGAAAGYGLGQVIGSMTPDAPAVGGPQIQQFVVSTSIEGIPITDLVGTSKMTGNLLWYGLDRTVELTEEAETGGKGGGGSQEYTTGYEYYMTWAMGLCLGPVDKLLAVYKNDDLVWEGELERPVSGGMETITLVVPPEEGETADDSQTMGTMHFYFGTDDQVAQSVMNNNLPDPTLSPDYRHLCYAFFDDCLMGEYNRMPVMKFVIQKCPVLDFSAGETINIYDYNPAHAVWYILEKMTHLPTSFLDEEKFSEFAAGCESDHLGVSILFDKQTAALSYLEGIFGHVDGVMRYGVNGKFQPVLVRADVAPGNMLLIDQDDITDELMMERKTWLQTLNEIKIQYPKITPPRAVVYSGVWLTAPDLAVGCEASIYCGTVTEGIHHGGYSWCTDLSSDPWYQGNPCYCRNDSAEVWNGVSWSASTPSGRCISDAKAAGTRYNAVIVGGSGATSSVAGSNQEFGICGIHIWNGVVWSEWYTQYPGYGIDNHAMVGNASDALLAGGRGRTDAACYSGSQVVQNDCYLWNGSIFSTSPAMLWAQAKPGMFGSSGGALQFCGATTWGGGVNNFCSKWNGASWATTPTFPDGGSGLWRMSSAGLSADNGMGWNGQTGVSSFGNNCHGWDGVSWTTKTSTLYFGRNEGDDGTANLAMAAGGGRPGYGGQHFYSPLCQTFGAYVTDTGNAVDFKQTDVIARDPANQNLRERVSHKTIQLGMFTNEENALWAADRIVKREGYPGAAVRFKANRNAFRLEPGDAFRLTYSQYGISQMIFRVARITEEGPESEEINIDAVEDVNYLSQSAEIGAPYTSPVQRDTQLDKLNRTKVVEGPYIVSGENIEAVTIAGRESLNEIGYLPYYSLDASSYTNMGPVRTYAVHGLLVAEYSADTHDIDDEIGFEIDFSNADVSKIESIARAFMLAGSNLALLGDEIISFQTITPVAGVRYKIEGVYRGRFDTVPETHSAGTSFYFLGTKGRGRFQNANFIPGVTRHFKLIPFNNVKVGSITLADQNDLSFDGRSRKPYQPESLRVNDVGIRPTYDGTGDLVVTWAPKHRTDGAGMGEADTMTDAAPTWEGYFKIEVYHWELLKRTVEGINDDEWTYTAAMNVTDGGPGTKVTFRLTNYRDVSGVRYECDPQDIIVLNSNPSVTTTTTTTTSTTSTSTTTTTTT